ncbi:MAG: DegT/DnrJ/EryC1/StrS family aminotransferase [Bacteroidota bacterium]
MINVTRTYLPPLKQYVGYLETIWAAHRVTNNGPLVVELEEKLKKYLGVKHLFFVSNGTIALQLAIRALGLRKEIITTPFSYVASTSSIVWEGCRPKFVDINPRTLCIDEKRIERTITRETRAILAVHVYGNPCEVTAIESIARKHGLKVIYDAAHAFGVKYKGRSVLNHGDISTISFHATKVFHTVEGGAVITSDDDLAHRLSYMRDFGHDGTERFFGLGVNGKNTELHAAMGLCVLPKVGTFLKMRENISDTYSRMLKKSSLRMPERNPKGTSNYAYYPVIFPSEEVMLRVRECLGKHEIFPRRYFYPSLNKLNYVQREHLPISEDISKRILCLPLYPDLKLSEVRNIAQLILEQIGEA